MELSWKWGCLAGSQAQILPSSPQACQSLDSLALSDHACSAFLPSPPAVRPEVPSDQAGPLPSQPLATDLMACTVRKSPDPWLWRRSNCQAFLVCGDQCCLALFPDRQCRLGTWAPGPGQPLLGHSEWYSVAFHQEHACLPSSTLC